MKVEEDSVVSSLELDELLEDSAVVYEFSFESAATGFELSFEHEVKFSKKSVSYTHLTLPTTPYV